MRVVARAADTLIYVQTISTEGRHFVQKPYFGSLYGLADNAFALDLCYPNSSKVIQSYQHCIEDKHSGKDE